MTINTEKYADSKRITDSYMRDFGKKDFNVDINQFMTNGGGRFAKAPQFEVLTDFYLGNKDIKPGIYSKVEIAQELGYDYYGWNMKQSSFQDNIDDYAERSYIYETMAFKISDNAKFVVNEDGSRKIDYCTKCYRRKSRKFRF